MKHFVNKYLQNLRDFEQSPSFQDVSTPNRYPKITPFTPELTES